MFRLSEFYFKLAIIAFIVISPGMSWASMYDPISGTLCIIVQSLMGPTGNAIAMIAVVFLGVGLFFGKINWGVAVAVGLGVGAIFGADYIVGWLSGTAVATCTQSVR